LRLGFFALLPTAFLPAKISFMDYSKWHLQCLLRVKISLSYFQKREIKSRQQFAVRQPVSLIFYELKDIVKSLRKCSDGKWESSGYYTPQFPGKPIRVEWKLNEHIVLEHEFLRRIVLDVLKNGRIGGIEFINLIGE
jgi:hypothetical protein